MPILAYDEYRYLKETPDFGTYILERYYTPVEIQVTVFALIETKPNTFEERRYSVDLRGAPESETSGESDQDWQTEERLPDGTPISYACGLSYNRQEYVRIQQYLSNVTTKRDQFPDQYDDGDHYDRQVRFLKRVCGAFYRWFDNHNYELPAAETKVNRPSGQVYKYADKIYELIGLSKKDIGKVAEEYSNLTQFFQALQKLDEGDTFPPITYGALRKSLVDGDFYQTDPLNKRTGDNQRKLKDTLRRIKHFVEHDITPSNSGQ